MLFVAKLANAVFSSGYGGEDVTCSASTTLLEWLLDALGVHFPPVKILWDHQIIFARFALLDLVVVRQTGLKELLSIRDSPFLFHENKE
jgi:hypothetical protein